MKRIFKLFILLITTTIASQNNDITSELYETYHNYKETSIDERRIKHADLQPLIDNLTKKAKYTIKRVGQSIEGRDLTLISIGSGKTNVLLWSQMHGDEPTATQAIFDIFNFLNSSEFSGEKEAILSNLTLHFLPMLNPDGAENFTRRNALGVDINRDAVRLQSPESKTLKRVRDSLNADFGFNLHDQSIYYNAERTDKPATISYLAPAYNYEKDINNVRSNAMKVIVFMNNIIQKYAPGQVGRYNDDFEPRAFGDNIQKWGTSTILIESGGYKNDVEKQEIRRLNYVSILSAVYTIAKENYKNISIKEYDKIPQNDRKLFDLKITGATYTLLDNDYTIDLGINLIEIDNEDHSDYYNIGKVMDQGDLSTHYGYNTFDANGYHIVEGNMYPDVFQSIEAISNLDAFELLKSGYTFVQTIALPEDKKYTSNPINVIKAGNEIPKFVLKPGTNSTFLLQKNDTIDYAVINGFLINLKTKESYFKNALMYR